MQDDGISQLLVRLGSESSQDAWSEFLQRYSPLLLHVARLFAYDEDGRSECFVHVCEQLGRDRFRRLRTFRPEGPASFSTSTKHPKCS